jgi:hypothetical protein
VTSGEDAAGAAEGTEALLAQLAWHAEPWACHLADGRGPPGAATRP